MSGPERKWLRHAQTGDRGFLVQRDGKTMVMYDRPAAEILVPYNPSLWKEEVEPEAMGRMQAAEIAFLADRRYLYFTGEFAKAKRDWTALRDEERQAWAKAGPGGEGTRATLFRAIVGVLAGRGES